MDPLGIWGGSHRTAGVVGGRVRDPGLPSGTRARRTGGQGFRRSRDFGRDFLLPSRSSWAFGVEIAGSQPPRHLLRAGQATNRDGGGGSTTTGRLRPPDPETYSPAWVVISRLHRTVHGCAAHGLWMNRKPRRAVDRAPLHCMVLDRVGATTCGIVLAASVRPLTGYHDAPASVFGLNRLGSLSCSLWRSCGGHLAVTPPALVMVRGWASPSPGAAIVLFIGRSLLTRPFRLLRHGAAPWLVAGSGRRRPRLPFGWSRTRRFWE